MTKFLLRLTLCTAALAAVTTTVANAADYEPPPPPEESWTGPYIGAFIMGVGVESHYDAECDDPADCAFDPEMSGFTWGGGVLAGFNFELGDGFLLGVEGDYGWAGKIDNDDPIEATEMEINNIATLRARAGYIFGDDTLFYATGGVAWVKTTFGGDVGDPNDPNRPFIDDSQWTTGYAIGGGIEHAFNDYLHARLEYIYLGLPDEEYDLEVGTVDLDFEGVHLIRAGATLNFGNFF
jgi:outer membrane immunogenic protein